MGKMRHREAESLASVSQLKKYGAGLTQADCTVNALVILIHEVRPLRE